MSDSTTVLAIDDDYELLRSLQRSHMAAQPGWDLVTLNDPVQAHELLHDTSLALMITDLVMPGTEGLSLIATARQRFPDLPVLVITGTEEEDPLVLAAIDLGILGILRKPFSAEEFFRFVESHLQGNSG